MQRFSSAAKKREAESRYVRLQDRLLQIDECKDILCPVLLAPHTTIMVQTISGLEYTNYDMLNVLDFLGNVMIGSALKHEVLAQCEPILAGMHHMGCALLEHNSRSFLKGMYVFFYRSDSRKFKVRLLSIPEFVFFGMEIPLPVNTRNEANEPVKLKYTHRFSDLLLQSLNEVKKKQGDYTDAAGSSSSSSHRNDNYE
eukprot:6114128-Pleurochrysis_carterae.AAC.1